MKNSKDIHLIPFASGAGAQLTATGRGPAAMRERGLAEALAAGGRIVCWAGDFDPAMTDLPALGSAARRARVLADCRRLADSVERAAMAGALPVTLGGDHAMAAGSLAGFARATGAQGRIGVLWVDAHADLHTPETSPSQAYHGMPMAFLLGLGDPDFSTIGGATPVLRPENLAYIGLRSTEAEEDARIAAMGIRVFPMKEIAPGAAESVFMQALAAVTQDIDYLALSIDLDAFDPADAPAVGSPEAGGLRRDAVLSALRAIARKRPFDMVEVAEFNPDLPGADKTYALLVDVLKAALGISC